MAEAKAPVPALLESEVQNDPVGQFKQWLDEAAAAGVPEPPAMTLATADASGRPSARMVLLRGFDARGFCFYTNYDSRKGRELAANPWATLVLYWTELNRQVRIEGHVERTTAEESDAYFQTRPRDSQLGAWASPQSAEVATRAWLEDRCREFETRFANRQVPRPPNWGGFRVVPQAVEFWQGRDGRLHDRIEYDRQPDGTWRIRRLGP